METTAKKKNGQLVSKMGRPSQGALSTYPRVLRNRIKRIRKDNEGWGPVSILIELEETYNYKVSSLPSESAVYLYLKQEGFIKEQEICSPLPNKQFRKARYAHHKWEMDAKGAQQVKEIGYQSLIHIKDVFSKTYCMSFPVAVKNYNTQPATIHYKWALRLAFTQWGRPKVIQVDKDSVFIENAAKSPFPKQLHLWLIGLGIEFSFIEYSPPIQNAIIERSHQTFYMQAMKGKAYRSWGTFFKNLLRVRKRLNEKYPSRALAKKAPLQAYPNARHSGNPYSVEQEKELLDLKRIYAFLTQFKWYRTVGKSSRSVYLGGQVYYVKKVPPKRTVSIIFCNRSKKLIFHDVNEQILIKLPIKGISVEALMGSSTIELESQYKKIFKARKFPI